jgi:hypothetical protein
MFIYILVEIMVNVLETVVQNVEGVINVKSSTGLQPQHLRTAYPHYKAT